MAFSLDFLIVSSFLLFLPILYSEWQVLSIAFAHKEEFFGQTDDRRLAFEGVKKKNMVTFENTETFKNLARSFAGECQAGMRYQMIAKLAMKEKLKTLSDAIRTIAKNETLHATQFFNKIIEKTGSRENIQFDAGYPFHMGTLAESLKLAANDEKSEMEDIYPSFALTAKKEGFEDIAALYKMVAEVESQHKIIFQYLHDAVRSGTLYKSETPLLWVCSDCGYMHVATEAWKVCPLCKAEQGYVDLHLPFQATKE